MTSVPATTPNWESIRKQMMLDPTVINLNTGSFGPSPRCVFDRATELRARLAEEPMDFLVRQAGPLLWQARTDLANFLSADPKRLVFTANVSSSINTIANSLTLTRPGDILLTDHEYGAMHWCWDRYAQRNGMTLRTFPLPVTTEDPEAIVSAAISAMSTKTRLLFFSHVLSPTGLVLPAKRLCEEARKRGIETVIDGAHAPAMIPLSLDDISCDFYGANCHKWLLAPIGSGFLYFGRGNETRLQPTQVSWGWKVPSHQPNERNLFGATHRIYQFEFEGTRDPCAWLSVSEAIAFQQQIGWQHIRERNESLVRYAHQRVGDVLGFVPWTPRHPQLHGFLTAFRLPAGIEAQVLRDYLWEKRIEVPIVERPDCLLLRISTHFYNTRDEIDSLVDVLRVYL